MKSIHSKNQLRNLHACLTPYEIYGLQYFSLKESLDKNFKDLTPFSRKIYFTILFTVSLMLGGGVIVLSSVLSEKVSKKNVLTLLYSEFINYTAFVALWVGLAESFASTTQIKKLFANSKSIIESCYHDLNVTMSFSNVRKSAWKRLLAMGVIFLLAQSTFTLRNKEVDEGLIVDIAVVVTFVTFFLVVINKFVFYVCFINFQLEFVNKILQNELACHLKQLNIKVYCLDTKSHKMKVENKIITKLQAIWRIYDKIQENASLVNKSLGISMFLTLMNLIMGMAYYGFAFCAAAMGDTSEDLIGNLEWF